MLYKPDISKLFTLKSSRKRNFLGCAAISRAVVGSDPIPEPPPIPELSDTVTETVNALGEPTFASLGLGGWTPVGFVQNCFEYLHVTLGIPWWEAIVIGKINSIVGFGFSKLFRDDHN